MLVCNLSGYVAWHGRQFVWLCCMAWQAICPAILHGMAGMNVSLYLHGKFNDKHAQEYCVGGSEEHWDGGSQRGRFQCNGNAVEQDGDHY